MKRKIFLTGMLIIVLTLVVTFTGCALDSGSGRGLILPSGYAWVGWVSMESMEIERVRMAIVFNADGTLWGFVFCPFCNSWHFLEGRPTWSASGNILTVHTPSFGWSSATFSVSRNTLILSGYGTTTTFTRTRVPHLGPHLGTCWHGGWHWGGW